MPASKRYNHIKMLRRLRADPKFIAIQQKAMNDQTNLKQYIDEVRKEFNLPISWDIRLQWYLVYPKLEIPLTGAGLQPYKDPVTGQQCYMIVVDPETTRKNVNDAYRTIQQNYAEGGTKFKMRNDNESQTAMEIMAYRLKQDGLKNSDIFKKLISQFPKSEDIYEIDVPIYVRSGKEKSMS